MLAPLGAKVVDVFPAVALDVLVSLAPMLAPPGAKVVDVFPAVALDVLVSLAPMLAPPGAKVVDVVLFAVVAAPASAAGLPPVVVAFCGKQVDCMSDVVVTLVPLLAGPTDAPLGAGVAAVSLLPPVACTG